jgi:hypothetical protein
MRKKLGRDVVEAPMGDGGELVARLRAAKLAFRRGMLLAATGAAVMLTGLLLTAGTASAANMFTLDAQGLNGTANVAMDSSGNVYVAWNHPTSSGPADSTPMFCKFALGSTCTSPVSLTLPAGAGDNETSGDFPILGTGSTVYVVGPRYVDDDTVVWTSTDGGTTFNEPGTVIANGYDQTGPESALLDGSNLLLGAVGSGSLAFDSTPINGATPVGQTLEFSGAGPFVASAALALDPSGNPVEAYWNDSTTNDLNYYFYKGTGSMDSQSSWTGPEALGIGQTPSLAGNSAGLYLLSADGSNPSNTAEPTAVDVRSYNTTSHTFNAPVTLLSNPESGFNEGGGIAETTAGKVVAIWPDQNSSGADVLDSFVSTNGGASFTPSYIATRSGYGGQVSVAAIDSGTGVEGVVAFNDDGGLELANLTPLPSPAPTPTPTAISTAQDASDTGTYDAADISIPAGTVGEIDQAIISGANASSATGTISYGLYSSSSCAGSSLVFNGGVKSVTGAVAPLSNGVTTVLAPGKYYWQVVYSGNATNDASASTCGSEVLTVTPATSIGGSGTSNGTTVTITVTCAATPCTVSVAITIDPPATEATRVVADKKKKPKAKTITLGSGTFKIKKKGADKLAVKLSKAGKKYLSTHHGSAKGAKLLISTKIDGHLEKSSRSITITTHKSKKKK